MPDVVDKQAFLSNFFYLLSETFESPAGASSAYLDKGTGLFDSLTTLSAEQASKRITTDGTSVAAQVVHTQCYLNVLRRYMQGHKERANWAESWQTTSVTPAQWDALQADLKSTYEQLRTELDKVKNWNDDAVGGSLAILVHSAYHLGAMRQIMRVVTQDTPA